MYFLRKYLICHNPEDVLNAWTKLQNDIGDAAIRQGLGQSTHLYTMFGEGMPLVRFAKQSGLTVITEIFILWSSHNILEQERQLFPELEKPINDSFSKEAQESGSNSKFRM